MGKDKKKKPFYPPVVEIIHFDDWENFFRIASNEGMVKHSQIDDTTAPPDVLLTSEDDSAEQP